MTTPDLRAEANKNIQALNDGMRASMTSFFVGTRHAQALTTEVMQMTMESLQCASEAMKKMGAAKSFDDMLRVEGDFLKTSLEGFTSHTAKMIEIAAAIPAEFAGRVTQGAQTATDAIRGAAETYQDAGARGASS